MRRPETRPRSTLVRYLNDMLFSYHVLFHPVQLSSPTILGLPQVLCLKSCSPHKKSAYGPHNMLYTYNSASCSRCLDSDLTLHSQYYSISHYQYDLCHRQSITALIILILFVQLHTQSTSCFYLSNGLGIWHLHKFAINHYRCSQLHCHNRHLRLHNDQTRRHRHHCSQIHRIPR